MLADCSLCLWIASSLTLLAMTAKWPLDIWIKFPIMYVTKQESDGSPKGRDRPASNYEEMLEDFAWKLGLTLDQPVARSDVSGPVSELLSAMESDGLLRFVRRLDQLG